MTQTRPRLLWCCNPHRDAAQPSRLVFWVFYPAWPRYDGAKTGVPTSVPCSVSPGELRRLLEQFQVEAHAAMAAAWADAAERL